MKKAVIITLLLVLGTFIGKTSAVEVSLFGPEDYTKTDWRSTTYKDYFTICDLEGVGKLTIINHGNKWWQRIRFAKIWLNGELICRSADFRGFPSSLVKEVDLQETNEIKVRLWGVRGKHISLEVTKDFELTPDEWEKISPNLQEYFVENNVFDPFKAIVKMADDDDILDRKTGFIVLEEYRPILPFTVVQINTHMGIVHIAQDVKATNIIQDFAYDILGTPSQDLIGQPLVEERGYVGAGAHVVVIDIGCDLTDPAFGDCTNAGDPNCSILEYVDLAPIDACSDSQNHGTAVAKKVLEAAPGARLIVLDLLQNGSKGCKIYATTEIEAMRWIFEHKEQYNIVAFNMSYGNYDQGAGAETLSDSYEKLHYREDIMPFAASGNDNRPENIFWPASDPSVVSVGAVDPITDKIWGEPGGLGSNRSSSLDFLAPGCTGDSCGTSLAAPMTAGAYAVLREAKPDLSVDETIGILKTTGEPIYDQENGLTFPRIQLDAALLAFDVPWVVYDNGASIHSGGTPVSYFIAADNFVLPVATNLIGASVDVSDGPADQNRRWDGTVEWWLFSHFFSLPGSLIASGTGVNVEPRNIVESPGGDREFTVDFDFGEEIALPAGQTFWLALHMQADYNRQSVLWDHQGSTISHPARKGGELIGGVPNFLDGQFAGTSPFDMAFRLWAK
jgi:hypothetical protein